jgi:ribosome modulation factor
MWHSIAYERGYSAAMRGVKRGDCPYAGHTNASLMLQQRWLDGHFDALTKPNERPRLRNSRGVLKTYGGRPRSAYVRQRLALYGIRAK